MIFKVFYQEHADEVPVRERTQTLYVEADHERDVRKKLAERNINIEFIQAVSEAHMEYEKRTEKYVLEQL